MSKDLRTNIKRIIAAHGLTSVTVAERLKLSKGSFSRIVSGNPTEETLYKIADAIGCKVADFFITDICEPSSTLTCPNCGAKLHVTLTIESEGQTLSEEQPDSQSPDDTTTTEHLEPQEQTNIKQNDKQTSSKTTNKMSHSTS